MINTKKTYLKEYLTILDFESGKVYQYEVKPNQHYEDYENFIIDLGFNLSNIEYMTHNDPTIY